MSSAIREGPLSEQPVRAQAPLSVSSMNNLMQKNELDGYIRPFNNKQLPIDHDLTDEAITKLIDAKQANEELHKIAARSRASAQLLSSNACVETAEILAAKFVTSTASSSSSGPSQMKKRHMPGGRNRSSLLGGQKKAAMKEIEEKKRGASDLHVIRHGMLKCYYYRLV